MIVLPMTQATFDKARQTLAKNKDVKVFAETSATTGIIKTDQVSLSYTFDLTGTLAVTVNEKHGVARFASEGTIKDHLQQLLAQV